MLLAIENNHTSGLQKIVFQTMGTFAGIRQMVWNQYQAYAIPRIEEATKLLKKEIRYLAELTPEQAQTDLEFMKAFSEAITNAQREIETIQDPEFERFRKASMEFFSVLIDIKSGLTKAASQKDSVRASFHYMSRTKKNPAIAKYL